MATLFRFRWERGGGHTHVRLFAGENILPEVGTLGLCGTFIMRNEEWVDFCDLLKRTGNDNVVILPEHGSDE